MTPESVGAGVDRVGQHLEDTIVGERRPGQFHSVAVGTSREVAAPERSDHPISRPGGHERGEHIGHRGLHLLVGVEQDGAFIVVDVAGG